MFEFLATVDVDWARATVDDVGRFVSWLRAPAPNVIVLDGGTARRSPATVNRHLTAVFGFYEHHARAGVDVAAGLVAWRRIGRGAYKPFLHHATAGRPVATRSVKLTVPRRAPRTLTPAQVVQVLAAPVRARDRLLLALLAETGMRVGQALGLRHADFVSRAKQVRIVSRSDIALGSRNPPPPPARWRALTRRPVRSMCRRARIGRLVGDGFACPRWRTVTSVGTVPTFIQEQGDGDVHQATITSSTNSTEEGAETGGKNRRHRRGLRLLATTVTAVALLISVVALTADEADAAVSNGYGAYARTVMSCDQKTVQVDMNLWYPQAVVVVGALDLQGYDAARIWQHDKASGQGKWITGWMDPRVLAGTPYVPHWGNSAYFVQYADYTSRGWTYSGEWAQPIDGRGVYC